MGKGGGPSDSQDEADDESSAAKTVTFHYHAKPVVIRAKPERVSELGGAVVDIFGDFSWGNVPTLTCLVDGVPTPEPAKWVSSTQVTCVAPKHPPGSVIFEVASSSSEQQVAVVSDNARQLFDAHARARARACARAQDALSPKIAALTPTPAHTYVS
jgi:hypothetical protein